MRIMYFIISSLNQNHTYALYALNISHFNLISLPVMVCLFKTVMSYLLSMSNKYAHPFLVDTNCMSILTNVTSFDIKVASIYS